MAPVFAVIVDDFGAWRAIGEVDEDVGGAINRVTWEPVQSATSMAGMYGGTNYFLMILTDPEIYDNGDLVNAQIHLEEHPPEG